MRDRLSGFPIVLSGAAVIAAAPPPQHGRARAPGSRNRARQAATPVADSMIVRDMVRALVFLAEWRL